MTNNMTADGTARNNSERIADSIAEKERLEKIKCVVVGDGGSGKTSLLTVYAKGEFPEDYVPTVFENYSAEINVNEKRYILMLWDTAGQEEYDRLRPLSYDNVDVIVVCYDVSTPASYENVTVRWAPETKHFCPGVPVVLVACKTDLRTKTKDRSETTTSMAASKKTTSLMHRNKIMSTSEGERLARQIKAAGFIECSAKLNENVSAVFTKASEQALSEDVQANFFNCCSIV